MDVRKYTLEETENQLTLTEIHAKQFPDAPKFCLDCLRKHLAALAGLADEGVAFFKEKPDYWIKLGKWAREYKEKLVGLDEKGAIQLAEEARQLRKELIEAPVEEEEMLKNTELLLHHLPGIYGSPGIVVNEHLASSTPCTGVHLDGKDMVWSRGIIGALDEGQKAKYCTAGIKFTERFGLKKRVEKFTEAAHLCSESTKHLEGREKLLGYLSCMSKELEQRGIKV